jgi:hypothetical protein
MERAYVLLTRYLLLINSRQQELAPSLFDIYRRLLLSELQKFKVFK